MKMHSKEYLLTTSQSTQQWSACVWDYNTLNIYRLYRNGGTIVSKTLNVIGNDYIISAEQNKPILHFWLLNSQEPSKRIRFILPEPATCLDICKENTFLIVGIGCKLYVWEISSGKLLSVQQKHFQPITCVKFSSDSAFVVVTGEDGMLVVYNLADLVMIHNNYLAQHDVGQVEPAYTRNDNSLPITDLHVGQFGRKSRLVTVSFDQTARLYNLLTGELLLTLTFEYPLSSVIVDTSCWQLFVGATTGCIKQFNLKSPPRNLIHYVNNETSLNFFGHSKKIVCLALNATSNILASGSEDNFVLIWEIQSRQILKKIEHKAAITNIRFVMDHNNFQVDIVKPKIHLKSLQRNFELPNNDDIEYIVMANEDLILNDNENSLTNQHKIDELNKSNRLLRSVNREMYNTVMDICLKK